MFSATGHHLPFVSQFNFILQIKLIDKDTSV